MSWLLLQPEELRRQVSGWPALQRVLERLPKMSLLFAWLFSRATSFQSQPHELKVTHTFTPAGHDQREALAEAGALDPTDETFREYERVVDPKYLEQIRTEAKQFSTKLLSRWSWIAECAIRSFKRGKNTIRPRTLRKLTKAIHDLQNKNTRN
jgi:hypothetical protein